MSEDDVNLYHDGTFRNSRYVLEKRGCQRHILMNSYLSYLKLVMVDFILNFNSIKYFGKNYNNYPMGNVIISEYFSTKTELITEKEHCGFHDIHAYDIKGNLISFNEYKDKKLLLIVNVASK